MQFSVHLSSELCRAFHVTWHWCKYQSVSMKMGREWFTKGYILANTYLVNILQSDFISYCTRRRGDLASITYGFTKLFCKLLLLSVRKYKLCFLFRFPSFISSHLSSHLLFSACFYFHLRHCCAWYTVENSVRLNLNLFTQIFMFHSDQRWRITSQRVW